MPSSDIKIPIGSMMLEGILIIPKNAKALVVFVHGGSNSRFSPRNNTVAEELRKKGFATLLFDLLSEEEDSIYENRFNIQLLSDRLAIVTKWLLNNPDTKNLKIGYFGSSTGSAAALMTAGKLGVKIHAIVSRGGRPDLAMLSLGMVKSPILLIVGAEDYGVIELNQHAYVHLQCVKEMELIPDATHLFEEAGTLDEVSKLAAKWFKKYLH